MNTVIEALKEAQRLAVPVSVHLYDPEEDARGEPGFYSQIGIVEVVCDDSFEFRVYGGYKVMLSNLVITISRIGKDERLFYKEVNERDLLIGRYAHLQKMAEVNRDDRSTGWYKEITQR